MGVSLYQVSQSRLSLEFLTCVIESIHSFSEQSLSIFPLLGTGLGPGGVMGKKTESCPIAELLVQWPEPLFRDKSQSKEHSALMEITTQSLRNKGPKKLTLLEGSSSIHRWSFEVSLERWAGLVSSYDEAGLGAGAGGMYLEQRGKQILVTKRQWKSIWKQGDAAPGGR